MVALLLAGTYSVNAQTTKVEQFGVVLTSDTSSNGWYLQNTTADSITVFVRNHREKVEELPGNNTIVMMSSGQHPEAHVVLAPGEKRYLGGIICIHSIGLYVGVQDDAHLITQQFYARN